MAKKKKLLDCNYCAAEFAIKYDEDAFSKPEYCPFCGEFFEGKSEDDDDDDDDDNDREDYD